MKDRTAPIQYFFNQREKLVNPFPVSNLAWERMGWDCERYQIYGDAFWKVTPTSISLKTWKIFNPDLLFARPQQEYFSELVPNFIPDWVKQDRIEGYGNPNPYTHYAGGIKTGLFTPPFLLTASVEIIYPFGTIPSIWLHNDLANEPVTREFDLLESSLEDGLWFAYHYSEKPNYQDRKVNISPWWCKLKGRHILHLEVFKDKALWYLNGRRIKKVTGNMNWNYFLLVSLIVTNPGAGETDWNNIYLKIES